MKRGWRWIAAFQVSSLFLHAFPALCSQDSCLILGPPVLTSNLLQFSLSGESGAEYVIESSADLTSWTRIATNTFDGNGNFSQTVPLSTTIPARFFSVQVQ